MTKTLIKEALRSITANKLRFLSVAVIIALGMSFFVGINSASPAMNYEANEYSKEYRARNLEKQREYDRMKAREYRARRKAQAAAQPTQ